MEVTVLNVLSRLQKPFGMGGPFVDLLNASSRAAKTDRRLRKSGELVAFR